MGVTGIGIGVGIGPFDPSKPSGSALDVITSSNGAWWVVAERDGSNNLVDQTGGGRNLTLPGGSANPVLLDHTGTDYFWFPGTTGNNLSIAGLSNSTTYDYTVTYSDTTTNTGSETTDGSGNLVFGNTQANFNLKKVTKVEVEPSGGGALVADVRATSADPDATTFAELISALTVTINRSTSGYCTEVVDQPKYMGATDDYLQTSGDGAFFAVDSDDYTLVWVGALRQPRIGPFDVIMNTAAATADGIGIRRLSDANPYAVRVSYTGASAGAFEDGAVTGNKVVSIANRLDRTAGELSLIVDGVEAGSPGDASGVGVQVEEGEMTMFATSTPNNYSNGVVLGAAFIKQVLTAAEISDIADALITANGGTP